ncbi:Sapep family Mn(2+)-dependent dipeptidase [Pseudoleptotrichia goodfellowii]|uniref:Dipeptidase PepV n=1 Tax=Pseudoleptotrichia goodfellowii F0264 TaxID=596323 RepID=D0GP66_9FUSO|nr:Sapep family Mn(2+)-dependent dipeptidase [Pseudoleptotrichia goodfellowii]EEY34116.1 dipeptidase PepV [Pseudoleptotrichia goodfellowii F0264]MBF4806355.1 Sapep family Mn(2+)-dependent dipeptidase [Pseudoleptotrichia goodfellowii]
MSAEKKGKIINEVKNIQKDLISSIRDLVSIYSAESTPSENAPFGDGPLEALRKVLNIAEKMGFHTENIDNKIGYAQYGESENDEYIGIFGHVDVVPLGEGWKHEPLKGEIENNRIYGRGVLDNKGPILANLFALFILKKFGITFDVPVRIVFGTNEETGFNCVKHYLTKEKPPVFGWTPDCKWPVVYGERGRLKVRVSAENKYAEELYNFVNDYILSAPNNGVKLGINFKDEDFGEMIMRGYKLGTHENRSYFEWAMSYPAICKKDELIKLIKEKLSDNLEIEEIANWDPILYDKTSKYVKTLQKVYNDVTGFDAKPVTTTGGTYAKIIPNIIAYGPSFPGQKDIAHLPDEWMDLDDLEKITEIYALALYEISKLKNKKE